jgi:hypothetical protein
MGWWNGMATPAQQVNGIGFAQQKPISYFM